MSAPSPTAPSRRKRWLAALITAAVVACGLGSIAVPTTAADAAVATGDPASMADYWNGDAEFVFEHKQSLADDGPNWMQGSSVEAMPDGTWYLFSRLYNGTNNECGMGVQVRKSTDQGASWGSPVVVLSAQAGTPWSCHATDGNPWYDAVNERWYYLFQCFDGTVWQGCLVTRDDADPQGPFTQPAGFTNPAVSAGELWDQICDDPADDCSTIAGGPGNVADEGTFDIFDYDGTYYWVSFHGYDQVKYGFRGIAKTTDFQTWIAGDPTTGTPDDAVFDRGDMASWRDDWIGNDPIGGGHGTILKEDGDYYELIEGADLGLGCIYGQHWDFGLLRSDDLTSTTWEQNPRGNPIVYSSRTYEATDGGAVAIPRCSVQYASLFKDEATGYIWLAYGRHSEGNADVAGLYWFRLEASDNLLVNGDLWRADWDGYAQTGTANIAVYRHPALSYDATPYMALNCGSSCVGSSIYQDAAITGGSSGTITYGGRFMTDPGTTGTLYLYVWQFDALGNVLKSDSVPLSLTDSWTYYSSTGSLLPGTTKIRYEMYPSTLGVQYRADDLSAVIS